jgi:hypothetical protein
MSGRSGRPAGTGGRRRPPVLATAGLLVVAGVALTGCTGGSSGHRSSAAPTLGSTPAAATLGSTPAAATRWWSNSAAKAGSAIDLADPLAAADRLHTSQTDYCTMLRDTVSAGRSILPGVTADDPALVAATRAFVAELQRVAPQPLAASWKVLGTAIVSLVESGGDVTKVGAVDTQAVRRASTTIAQDARSSCHVEVRAARP